MDINWKPVSLPEGKLAVELGSETVVYELDRDRASALNPLGAYLWRSATGSLGISDLARNASEQLAVTIAPEALRAAAEELVAAGLIAPPPSENNAGSAGRRRLLRQAAFAAPLITTLVVPPPVAAGSAGPPPPPPPGTSGDPSLNGASVGGSVGGAAVAASALLPACPEQWHRLSLSPYINRSLEERGLANFGGPRIQTAGVCTYRAERIPFSLERGAICLAGKSEPALPQQVRNLPVEQKFQHLYLLHTATGHAAFPGEYIGRFIVRYQDGDTAIIPLQYGLDVTLDPGDKASHLRSRTITGSHPPVFCSVWRNPRPDLPVTAIDFESAMAPAAPVCLALTASTCRKPRAGKSVA